MTANRLFNQIQADALGRPIICSRLTEISGWGAAVAAGIGSKQISLEEYSRLSSAMLIRYHPKNTVEIREHDYRRWKGGNRFWMYFVKFECIGAIVAFML